MLACRCQRACGLASLAKDEFLDLTLYKKLTIKPREVVESGDPAAEMAKQELPSAQDVPDVGGEADEPQGHVYRFCYQYEGLVRRGTRQLSQTC